MSAFDIAGAVVWPLNFVLIFLSAVISLRAGTMSDERALAVVMSLLATALATVFCIARLFGAHP